ncbi:ROK family protein [Specibacter cremeus]|uniref:ROK family protein n=1 Tax=Specibacter cremeus TaxID=1629051 RepID=UPI001F0C3CEF|nr:ROK family protein [Specibacter cremeus]
MKVPPDPPSLRRRGTNLPKMGDFNTSVVVDAIRRSAEGLSRVELAAATGLAAQTVSNICRRLLDQDLVVEAGKETNGPGKPRTMLRINPRGLYAVGLHIDPAVTSYAVVDAVGTVLAARKHASEFDDGPEAAVARMGRRILDLVKDSGVDATRVIGVGAATPGPVDVSSGTVVAPPHMPGWWSVPLRDILARETGLPVVMDKDVTAAAVAELWTSGAGRAGSFVYLYIGTGIGAGLVLNNEVARGSSGNAGEIGHIITDPDGPECDCGRRGCVKVTCMPETIVSEALDAGVEVVWPGATLQQGLAALVAAADDGDSRAVAVLERSAWRMAGAASVLTNLLDVDRVVFGGPFWKVLSVPYLRVIPGLLERLSVTASVRSLTVSGAVVGPGREAFGAACLIMEHTLSPNADHLLLEAR